MKSARRASNRKTEQQQQDDEVKSYLKPRLDFWRVKAHIEPGNSVYVDLVALCEDVLARIEKQQLYAAHLNRYWDLRLKVEAGSHERNVGFRKGLEEINKNLPRRVQAEIKKFLCIKLAKRKLQYNPSPTDGDMKNWIKNRWSELPKQLTYRMLDEFNAWESQRPVCFFLPDGRQFNSERARSQAEQQARDWYREARHCIPGDRTIRNNIKEVIRPLVPR